MNGFHNGYEMVVNTGATTADFLVYKNDEQVGAIYLQHYENKATEVELESFASGYIYNGYSFAQVLNRRDAVEGK